MTDERGPLRASLTVLEEDECRRLLDEEPVGRVAFVRHGQPLVMPVNFTVDRDTIVFRTSEGSKLDVAEREAGVAVSFECDDYDAQLQDGWSVLVKGVMHPVVELTETTRLDRLGLRLWTDDVERRRWIRIEIREITGRRIVRP